MDLKGITLGKALRMRSTIANKIKQANERAIGSAVFQTPGPVPDFDVNEQIGIYVDEQQKLREMKVKIAVKSLNTKVTIPDDVPVAEAGMQVPVYAAVLIRDDLKSRRQLLSAIINLPLVAERPRRLYGEPEPTVEKKRNFEFENAVKLSEELQNAIDTLDGIIQGTDAVTKFE